MLPKACITCDLSIIILIITQFQNVAANLPAFSNNIFIPILRCRFLSEKNNVLHIFCKSLNYTDELEIIVQTSLRRIGFIAMPGTNASVKKYLSPMSKNRTVNLITENFKTATMNKTVYGIRWHAKH